MLALCGLLALQRRTALSLGVLLCLLALAARPARAQDPVPFDCAAPQAGGRSFDLTALAGEHVVTRTRETPPSRVVDELRFDLCADLPRRAGVADADQCPSGTRACLTMTNQKGDEGDRVIAVIPLGVSAALNASVSALTSPAGLNVVFRGSAYPTTNPIPQSFNVSILCDSTQADPVFVSYYGWQLAVEWRSPAGCGSQASEPHPGGGEKDKEGGEEHVGSGLGWFFLLFLIAFAAYFVLGAYYNYSNYGATGADLIPHRDFWREVPYILRDVGAHLCSAFRPSPRNGYIAV
ncbi:autophagy-related protein 27 [Phellopilus nigrolimitatus]|nr:autophagy-related protein 27 [Phellopilus nigrolimitatus]